MPDEKINIKFIFKINPEVPRGKVGVKELKKNRFLVLACEDVPDNVIINAIAKWCARHSVTYAGSPERDANG
jgi:hypothetical protein